MKRYCFDTSGLSNPLEAMPERVYPTVWRHIGALISSQAVAVTAEIFGEMEHLGGEFGKLVRDSKAFLLLEIGDSSWPYPKLQAHPEAGDGQVIGMASVTAVNPS